MVAEDDLRVRVPVPVARLLSRLLAKAALHALRADRPTEETCGQVRSTAAPLLSPLQLEPTVSLQGELVRSPFHTNTQTLSHANTPTSIFRGWRVPAGMRVVRCISRSIDYVSTVSLAKRR